MFEYRYELDEDSDSDSAADRKKRKVSEGGGLGGPRSKGRLWIGVGSDVCAGGGGMTMCACDEA